MLDSGWEDGSAWLDRESKWGLRLALASVILGIVLAVSKIWVGYLAHSAAVISDGFESSGDVFSSAMVYAGLRLASKPPDDEHPYGHGRYETLAGLAVGAVLLLTGAAIFWSGLTRTAAAHPLPWFVTYPLIAAVLLKSCFAAAKIGVGRRIKSLALQADAVHDLTDLLSTGVAILSVGLVLFDASRFAWADRAGGMVIGVIIFFCPFPWSGGWSINCSTRCRNPSGWKKYERLRSRFRERLALKKCFARRTGLRYHVDLHLEVDPQLSVRASHDIATRVRMRVRERLPWVADVLVHVEPSAVRASFSRL